MKAESTTPRRRGRPPEFDRQTALQRACSVFWRRGFEPATVAELCDAMGINPPSLYAAFGNKVKLFLEAVDHYEKVYWDETWNILMKEADLRTAIAGFFADAARVLTLRDAPCGCLVILGAANVSAESQAVNEALRVLRDEGKEWLLRRLDRGVAEGQLPPGCDTEVLALTLNTLLEGMSVQARDGASREDLRRIASMAAAVLPASSQAASEPRKPTRRAAAKTGKAAPAKQLQVVDGTLAKVGNGS